MKKKLTYKIATLGCRTNQYESAAYQKQLESLGYRQAEGEEEADVCVVNTCTVTQAADTESKRQTRQIGRQNPNTKIFVTGCAAQRDPKGFSSIDLVNNVALNEEKEILLAPLANEMELPEFSIENFPGNTRAFVKIQDGCNSYCSYCIIPYVRGRSRSKSHAEILKEVKKVITQGYHEIVLTGINIGDYDGGGEDKTLAQLVRDVDSIEGIKRLRISSIDPDEIDDDLLDAVINGKHTCPSMHIVLQSGSNFILNRMRRKYSKQIFFDTCRRLKKACPDFTFTTDVIVGFPGETQSDHEQTLEVIKEIQFSKVHMFPYSERPKTRSSRFEDKVDHATIQKRKRDVLEVAEKNSFALRENFLNRRMKVLLESFDSRQPDRIGGHTDNFLYVYVPLTPELKENSIIEVVLEKNTPEGFQGRVVPSLERVNV
jgi:threonylcarbamoyladenosine tRNA methylthiotransferase MtaB